MQSDVIPNSYVFCPPLGRAGTAVYRYNDFDIFFFFFVFFCSSSTLPANAAGIVPQLAIYLYRVALGGGCLIGWWLVSLVVREDAQSVHTTEWRPGLCPSTHPPSTPTPSTGRPSPLCDCAVLCCAVLCCAMTVL